MEILQNTILKLVVLQGSDSDRKQALLTSGEPAFTTDLKRFYVGDGETTGGVVVGNLYLGSGPDKTAFVPGLSGDIAFDTDKNKLYRILENDGSSHGDWEYIGGVYNNGDGQLSFSVDNQITLNPLSANFIDGDAVEYPIYINSGRVGLQPLSANFIHADAVTSPLVIDSGRIALTTIPTHTMSSNTITVLSSGLVSTSNGSPSTGNAVNSLSSNITIASNQLYSKYNALSTLVTGFSKNITQSATVSAGHYRFTFDQLPTSNLIVNSQIYGLDALGYEARTIMTTTSSCDVKVINLTGGSTNANVSVLISY